MSPSEKALMSLHLHLIRNVEMTSNLHSNDRGNVLDIVAI